MGHEKPRKIHDVYCIFRGSRLSRAMYSNPTGIYFACDLLRPGSIMYYDIVVKLIGMIIRASFRLSLRIRRSEEEKKNSDSRQNGIDGNLNCPRDGVR